MMALVIVTGILFGIAPALQATKVDAAESLKEGGRSSTASAAGVRLRSLLIISEVALAFILLSSAGLLIRSFYQLQEVDTGFDTTNVITAWLPMDDKQYTQGPQITEYYRQILDKVQAVPGVRDVATKHALGADVPWQIVGVVADEKVGDLDDSSPGVYVPMEQSPTVGSGLVVRGSLNPNRLVKSIERAVWQVNKNQALTDLKHWSKSNPNHWAEIVCGLICWWRSRQRLFYSPPSASSE
ncbi:MAG: hypothetical protein M3Y57_19570 [Acidobacteriota bacterium]|nr:hypothetical protein [Acidobacteriota bacterium]